MLTEQWIPGGGDLTDAYALRSLIFTAEQGTPEEEDIDGRDDDAVHLVLYDGGCPVATGRIFTEANRCYLGRICVRRERRKSGLGEALTRALIRQAEALGHDEQFLHAQIQARGFYERLGFAAVGEPYMEVGIPHISMRRARIKN
jgi:predicted GNAT family N-acyltransferase